MKRFRYLKRKLRKFARDAGCVVGKHSWEKTTTYSYDFVADIQTTKTSNKVFKDEKPVAEWFGRASGIPEMFGDPYYLCKRCDYRKTLK